MTKGGQKKEDRGARSGGDSSGSVVDADAVARLESEERALASVLAEFEHEARRVRDQLERRGGRAFMLEQRLDQLQKNIVVTRRDLDRVRGKLASNSGGNA